jgi:Fur family ferric uptake transcriptional regulator
VGGAQERPRDLVAFLREQGLRATTQRLLILETLRDSAGHITAEQIYQRVVDRLPSLSIVSVYRTLEFFADRGIATRTNFGDRAVQWEWFGGSEHHHLLCRACGHRQEISGTLFAEAAAHLQRDYGFRAELRHLALWGTCADCQAAQQENSVTADEGM